MSSILPILGMAALASGCLSETIYVDGGQTTGSQLKSGYNLLPIIHPSTFVVVETWRSTGSILVREIPEATRPLVKELFLRVFDANGVAHHQNFTIPELAPGEFATFEFDYPEKAPFLVTAECGCVLAWLKNVELDPRVKAGDRSLVTQENRSIVLSYDPANVEDLTNGRPLHDEETYELDIGVIHWGFLWGQNLRGNFTVRTPTGRELVYLEAEGREITGGHVSNGSTPLELGTWRLQLEGVGWFQYDLRLNHLSPEAWGRYGIKPPSGVTAE